MTHIIGEYKAFNHPHTDYERETVRGIILNDKHLFMLYSGVLKDYTFPGGGVEMGERHQEALKREVLEETGMNVQDGTYVGSYIEYVYDVYDPSKTLKRTNHYYVLTPGEQLQQHLTQEEKRYDLTPTWITIDEVIQWNQHVIDNQQLKRDPYYIMKELNILQYIKETLL